jgi:zinc D-Ala-D-Ala carboxypeptidase
MSVITEDYRLSPHFRVGEFKCPCCGIAPLAPLRRLCEQLELARSRFGPMEIASGYRCQMHNLEVEGARFSRHMQGLAADIKCYSDGDRFRLMSALLTAGFRRIGVGRLIVHADIDTSAVPVMWTYYQ